jgi:hypothetical protein
MRAFALAAALALVLASPALARVGFRASLRAPTHTPSVGKGWTYVVTARYPSGQPASATVVARVLDRGKVIDTIGWNGFKGRFRDTYRWPDSDRGRSLVFQARVIGPGGSTILTYRVRVR